MSTDDSDVSVLVVDDEHKIARAHERWLQDEYEVATANSGAETLDCIDEETDVVLLDRMMPGMDGDEVVDEIRNREAVQDCLVIMVTAAEPDFDIVELGFDDYVVKPADEATLKGTIESVLEQQGHDYDEKVRELYSLSSKRAVLVEHKTERELAQSEEKQRLDDRIETLRAEITDDLQDVDSYSDAYDELL